MTDILTYKVDNDGYLQIRRVDWILLGGAVAVVGLGCPDPTR
jgi:hypothetical protein